MTSSLVPASASLTTSAVAGEILAATGAVPWTGPGPDGICGAGAWASAQRIGKWTAATKANHFVFFIKCANRVFKSLDNVSGPLFRSQKEHIYGCGSSTSGKRKAQALGAFRPALRAFRLALCALIRAPAFRGAFRGCLQIRRC